MKPYPGKFYIQFNDETISEAIGSHFSGFETIEEAILDAHDEDSQIESFKVINDKRRVVYRGVTGGKHANC